jgi:hypothetical protein
MGPAQCPGGSGPRPARLRPALGLREQRDHLRAGFQRVQVVGPSLHHLAPCRQVLGEVVGRAYGVALRVGKLALDGLMVPALFVQPGQIGK